MVPMKFSVKTSAAVVAAGTLAFTTACSSDSTDTAANGDGANGDNTINIVTSTSIWGDVAQAVADTATGANITVTPIVTGNAIDPHSFEPTAADIARANDADIVVAGGGGYDAWLYEPLSDQDKVIAPLPLVGHSHDHDHDHGDDAHDDHSHDGHDHGDDAHAHDDHGHDHGDGHDHESHDGEHSHDVEMIDGNEHIWYDTNAITVVAEKVAEQINAAVPDAGANADAVVERLDGFHQRIHDLPELKYIQSEVIADYITSHSHMTDITPDSYRQAVLNHSEPSAADLAGMLNRIDNGDAQVLIYNPQTKTDLTERILNAAKERDVQIVEIGETPPEGTNFLDYYDQVLSELEALKA